MKNLLLLLPMLLFLFSCSQRIKYSVEAPATAKVESKKDKDAIQQKDGKCLINCIIPDHYETSWVTLPIYYGSDADAPVRTETLLIEAAKNSWSKNSSGEITLVQTPAVTKEVRVLVDTLFYKDFRFERFETQKLVKSDGVLHETEVLCSDARTPNIFLQISAALKSFGYLETPKTEWDMKFSQAIQQFQKDNSLPIGDLNLETLQFMGI